MRNTVPQEHIFALSKITQPIHAGKFDFSNKEKIAYTFIAGLAGYFSWESAKFYFITGGAGTKYLPIGNFTSEFGGQAAFWSNASLNWYFMMSTVMTARHAYYHYQLAKELNIDPELWKSLVKLSIALIMATTAGIVFAFIATSTHSLYNELVTGAVNTLLNYLGCFALEGLIIFGVSYIANKFVEWCCKKTDIEDTEQTAEWITEYLEEKTDKLNALPNDDAQWTTLATSDGHQRFIAATNQSITTLLLADSTEKKLCSASNIISFFVHALMQILDKFALFGYFQDTVKSVGDWWKLKNTVARNAAGLLMFLPFGGLSLKIVYDTTKEIIDLVKIAYTSIVEFYKHPNWSKETFIKLAFIIPATALALMGYFFAYVSSNTSLQLNANYGWDQWWSVYSTCVGVTIFNGFGFLGIILASTAFLMSYALYTPEKRDVIHRHNQVTSFFQSYPDALDQLAEQENLLECNFEF